MMNAFYQTPAAHIRLANNQADNFFAPEADSEDFFNREGQLACDVYQDKDNIVVKATMAGVQPKNLDITVSNDLLTIRGFREDQKENRTAETYAQEIYWGAFSRSIVLPQEVDQNKVKASLKNGVLTITLPKKYKTSTIKIRQSNDRR